MSSDTSAKPWSLLAYTVADDKSGGDPLDAPVKREIKALCDAVDFGHLSVAAQVDFKFTPGIFRAALTAMPQSREFEDISADEQPLWREISSRLERTELRVQKERVDLNAAGSGVLAEFLRYGMEQCPAQRHVFFMYGHASGPMGLFYDRESSQHVPHTMRLNDLADALQGAGGRIAVMLFRDCFMSNLEAAYQLKDVSQFMIASQSVVPVTGIWPWHDLLPAIMHADENEAVALKLADAIGVFLDAPENRGPFTDAPLSLLDLREAEAVTGPLAALVGLLEEARNSPDRNDACARAIDAARIGYPNDPTRSGDPGLVDLITMCDNLVRLGSDPVVAPARQLAAVLRGDVVRWFHAQEHRFQGVSLYCKPTTKKDIKVSVMQAMEADEAAVDAAAYRELALCKATGWDRIALNPLIARER